MFMGALVRWVTGWRGETAWIEVAVPLLVCGATAMLYVPFRYLHELQGERLGWHLEEPIAATRAMADAAVAACVLAAVFICVTRMRRTPASARYVALTAAGTLTALLLSLVWILVVMPLPSG